MNRSLLHWLEYIQQQHPVAIDMGLERIRAVAQRMGLTRPGRCVITVAGTNGKGSTVAYLEAIARAAGLRVGAYTSPHLLRFNERLRIDGDEIGDADLIEAFTAIEDVRGDTGLTYFEYATLAAFWWFERAQLDLAILEVGLGGRLDATNLIDADVAVITTVDLDHQAMLGNDREAIGVEKAGILRAGKPCVLAEKDPPSSVLRRAYAIGAFAIRGHCDYLVDREEARWVWREPGFSIDLPWPALAAPAQLDNAAAAVAALRAANLPVSKAALRKGIATARLPGRLQRISESPEVVLDVGHNPQAARQLAQWLREQPRPTQAVFSVLADKDLAGIVQPLAGLIDAWHVAPLVDAGVRALTGPELVSRLTAALPGAACVLHADLEDALVLARTEAGPAGRVLVFGSFHTVSAVLAAG